MISKLFHEAFNGKKETIAFWKKGSFFEKGKWHFFEIKTDNGSGALFALALYFVLLVFIGSLILSLLAIIFALIGFQINRERRYIAGFLSFCGLLFFFIDLHQGWVSSLFFSGWYSDNNEFNEGLLGLGSLIYFKILNLIGFGLGLGFIIDCFLISNYKERIFHQEKLFQIISYSGPAVLVLIIFYIFK